jgi:predicted esterase
MQLPHFVLFLSDPRLIEGERISPYVYKNAEKVGLSTFILSDYRENLPNECSYFLDENDMFEGISFGGGRLPVFMCGFSGGARFTAAFAESHPRSLRGWCAASFDDKNTARFSDDNQIVRRPPGIVACGADDPRIGAARAYFGRGRVAGRRWTWLEVAGLGHGRSPVIDGFARAYFLALQDRRARGVWMDVGSRNDVAHSRDTARELQAWLPDAEVAALWRDVSLRKEHGIVEHVEKVKQLKSYRQLTMFLRMPSSGRVKGVLCLCLLADSPMEVREKIRGDEDRRIEPVLFAERQDLAIIAWGSRCLWDPSSNWNELSRMRERGIDRDFDLAAEAWEAGVRYFERTCGLPSSGYLMSGFSGSAQYALRLAMRRPERFLAVHVHVPSSFDRPSRKASSVLWCLTTGENEMGYERSRAFFEAARGMGYPVVYKAYPGLGHAGDARATALGYACFEYALAEYGRVRKGRGNGSGKPDWESVFAGSDFVADIVNQQIFSAADADCIPPEFRISLPSEDIRAAWKTE